MSIGATHVKSGPHRISVSVVGSGGPAVVIESVSQSVRQLAGVLMSKRSKWHGLRERRMAESGACEGYEAEKCAFELLDQAVKSPTTSGADATSDPS